MALEGTAGAVVQGTTATEELSAVGVGIQDMVGFVSQQAGLGVGEVYLTHHTSSGSTTQTMLTLTPTTVASAVEHVHMTTDTGASVLLYSCGSCNQTFTSQGDLEEHQTLHLGSLGPGSTVGPGNGEASGAEAANVGLVGAGPLLADFEEVVETTTAAETGQGGVGGQNGQAEYDLLQGFTTVPQLPSDASVPTDTTGGAATVSNVCTYCGKSFKTSSGLTRHVTQVRLIRLQKEEKSAAQAIAYIDL